MRPLPFQGQRPRHEWVLKGPEQAAAERAKAPAGEKPDRLQLHLTTSRRRWPQSWLASWGCRNGSCSAALWQAQQLYQQANVQAIEQVGHCPFTALSLPFHCPFTAGPLQLQGFHQNSWSVTAQALPSNDHAPSFLVVTAHLVQRRRWFLQADPRRRRSFLIGLHKAFLYQQQNFFAAAASTAMQVRAMVLGF